MKEKLREVELSEDEFPQTWMLLGPYLHKKYDRSNLILAWLPSVLSKRRSRLF